MPKILDICNKIDKTLPDIEKCNLIIDSIATGRMTHDNDIKTALSGYVNKIPWVWSPPVPHKPGSERGAQVLEKYIYRELSHYKKRGIGKQNIYTVLGFLQEGGFLSDNEWYDLNQWVNMWKGAKGLFPRGVLDQEISSRPQDREEQEELVIDSSGR